MQAPLEKIRLGIGIILALLLFVYGAYETRDVIQGPSIIVATPKQGETVEKVVTVEGTARNISRLALNGRQIFTDASGRFREQLLVPEGYTILELEAQDTFSRNTKQLITITRTTQ